MYLIISDADDSVTSSRASKVFHDEVDVTRLRTFGEENVRQRREGPTEKRRFVGEGPNREGLSEKVLSEKAFRRRFVRKGPPEKRVAEKRAIEKESMAKT